VSKGEEGIALIAVLWTLVLLSIVAASFALETRTEARIASNMTNGAVERAAADAGIQRAILDLVNRRYGRPLDTTTEFGKFRTDGRVYAWRFDNSAVFISVLDERAKVDLNKAPEDLLSVLFTSVGVDAARATALAYAVADFRDQDDFRRPQGAEEAEYRAARMGWGPKNGAFEAVEELQQVLGMTKPVYERVAPYLTVYSTYPVGIAINANLATQKLKEILAGAGMDSKYFVNESATVYTVRAEAKGASGAVFVREAVVQTFPGSVAPARVLAWRQGSTH
jgi:general secretion pathway protein K